jgi:hypothetical protein
MTTKDWWNSAKEPPIKLATKDEPFIWEKYAKLLSAPSADNNNYKKSLEELFADQKAYHEKMEATKIPYSENMWGETKQYKLDVKATPYSKQEPLNQVIQQEKSFWNGVALWLGTGAAICG